MYLRPVTVRTRRPKNVSPGFGRGRRRGRRVPPTGPWRPWDALHYRVLLKYAQREGHARVPGRQRQDGLQLGSWVHGKRRQLDRLTSEQITALERVPGWAWRIRPTPRRLPFPRLYQLLRQYVDREGHARVPPKHVEAGLNLGKWVNQRRQAFLWGRLLPDQVRRLEGFAGWVWSPRAERFLRMLALLRRYAKREGHARVPAAHVEARLKLGQWVSARRAEYRRGRLSKGVIETLERLPGWGWRIRSP